MSNNFVLLYIGKGIGINTRGLPASAKENPMKDPIDFMSKSGFSLQTGGWIPQYAQLKGGGVFTDNQLVDGRGLVGGGFGNVVETFTLTSTNATIQTRSYMQKRLFQYARDAVMFHTTDYQVEPIWLAVQSKYEVAPRYALIFKIEVARQNEGFGDGSMDIMTVTIEREPFWRNRHPGTNPKIETLEANGVSWDYNDLTLASGSTNFVAYDATLINQRTTFDPFYNYIKIPREDISGDAPALTLVNYEMEFNENYAPNRVFVARMTHDPDGEINVPDTLLVPGSLSTDTATVADTGGVDHTGNGTEDRAEVSFATDATFIRRMNATPFNMTQNPGKYAIFCRCRQVNGAAGDINIKMVADIKDTLGDLSVETDPVSPELEGTTGATAAGWPVTYMGTLEFPLSGRTIVESDGKGRQNFGELHLYAERTTGTGVLYVCDFFLLPHSEPSAEIRVLSMNASIGTGYDLLMDNTGYMLHGEIGESAGVYSSSVSPIQSAEIRGELPTLEPNLDNYLHFFTIGNWGATPNRSVPDHNFTIRLNLMGRWQGLRDA